MFQNKLENMQKEMMNFEKILQSSNSPSILDP
jgi:hypothetical protein